ncbi:DUF6236 family protein [Sulfitobacter alexandrii]|uniref:DUF6236 family protein n=1 Tax=Sulfitobacter alexandrii TaxID=1917485 RepID=UPI0012EC0734|nr:DUF6236 family protein [Sulfitobacter alexandrii]
MSGDGRAITMLRGVMLPPIGTKREDDGRTSFFISGDGAFLSTVPAAVLYWDRLYAPIAIRGMAPHYDAAVESLVALGIAESFDLKSENEFSLGDIPSMISKYAASLDELDSRDSQVWSVMPLHPDQKSTLAAQSSPYFPKPTATIASIEVQLRNALPVPDREVPFEDLLEFKNSRKDQIGRLHAELSQVASRYVGAMDDEKALSSALIDVNTAVSELHRVYEEKWIKRTTKSLTSAFAFEGALPAGVAYLLGVEIDKAFLVGAGVAIAKSAVTASVPDKHKDHPYSYVLGARNI